MMRVEWRSRHRRTPDGIDTGRRPASRSGGCRGPLARYPTWGNSESEIPDECKFHWVFMEMSLD
jgi:hypothetical protein